MISALSLRHPLRLCGEGCFTVILVATLHAQTPPVKLDDPAVISSGNSIFASTCAVGYCHGKEGKAGRGPRLAGRKLDPSYVFITVTNGINKSLMPSFKSQLSPDQIWSVVAYILTLSGDGSAPSLATTSSREAPQPPATAPLIAKPSDPNAGDPEAGRALFFDASNSKHCAGCHQFQGRGNDVGPDLTAIASRPPKQILQDIVDPDARLSAEVVTVLTKSGERITGVKKQEARDRIRLYDTSSLPPVLRTIYKDQIQSVTPERQSPMPHDYGKVFTPKQLLNLISLFKSAPVSPNELQ